MALPNKMLLPVIEENKEKICASTWIKNLCSIDLRYDALRELALRSTSNFELGMVLWHSFGAVAALLQEITTSYPAVLSGCLTWDNSNRLCWTMSLFQVIARHAETRIPFLRSDIMMFLLPILNVTVQTEPIEHVKLAVMGVIGGLVKMPSNEVISFLLGWNNILYVICHFLYLGSRLSKLISAYILRRILEHDIGLQYLSSNAKDCYHVVITLSKVVHQLAFYPKLENRILDNILGSYKRLTLDKYANHLLQTGFFPEPLQNNLFFKNGFEGYEDILEDLRYINLKLRMNLQG